MAKVKTKEERSLEKKLVELARAFAQVENEKDRLGDELATAQRRRKNAEESLAENNVKLEVMNNFLDKLIGKLADRPMQNITFGGTVNTVNITEGTLNKAEGQNSRIGI